MRVCMFLLQIKEKDTNFINAMKLKFWFHRTYVERLRNKVNVNERKLLIIYISSSSHSCVISYYKKILHKMLHRYCMEKQEKWIEVKSFVDEIINAIVNVRVLTTRKQIWNIGEHCIFVLEWRKLPISSVLVIFNNKIPRYVTVINENPIGEVKFTQQEVTFNYTAVKIITRFSVEHSFYQVQWTHLRVGCVFTPPPPPPPPAFLSKVRILNLAKRLYRLTSHTDTYSSCHAENNWSVNENANTTHHSI